MWWCRDKHVREQEWHLLRPGVGDDLDVVMDLSRSQCGKSTVRKGQRREVRAEKRLDHRGACWLQPEVWIWYPVHWQPLCCCRRMAVEQSLVQPVALEKQEIKDDSQLCIWRS